MRWVVTHQDRGCTNEKLKVQISRPWLLMAVSEHCPHEFRLRSLIDVSQTVSVGSWNETSQLSSLLEAHSCDSSLSGFTSRFYMDPTTLWHRAELPSPSWSGEWGFEVRGDWRSCSSQSWQPGGPLLCPEQGEISHPRSIDSQLWLPLTSCIYSLSSPPNIYLPQDVFTLHSFMLFLN